MPGHFDSIDIGGRALRYCCEGDGTPTVVVDQGQGMSLEQGSFSQSPLIGWAKIFAEVRKATRICMHDRAGLGSSDPADSPRTSQDMVDDLRTLLQRARIAPPYVLVGQSLGGFNVRLFASHYPAEVAGMVLVDSSHPDQSARFRELLPPELAAESPALRLLRHGRPPSASREGIDFAASAQQVRKIRTLGRLPLVVLSQSPDALPHPGFPPHLWDPMRRAWAELQSDLLRLSINSEHVVAAHAGHLIHLEEPQLVIDAILGVIQRAR